MKLTSQGVRDLNGPRMDGTGHNGRRSSATCLHHKNPDMAVERRDELVPVLDATGDRTGEVRKVSAHYCVSCGERRWDDTDN